MKRIEIGPCTLFNGDCIEALSEIEEVHGIVADPPYCSGGVTVAGSQGAKAQGVSSQKIRSDGFRWFKSDTMTAVGLCDLLRRVVVQTPLDPAGSVLFFCDWRMVPFLAPALESAGLRYRNLLTWDKQSPALGTGFRAQHEQIIHLTGAKPVFHSKRLGNVLSYPRPHHTRKNHPTEKPVQLMADLIETTVPPGGIVFDPFAGAGSTALAAIQTGRRFVGCELDPEFFDRAAGRIAEAWAQHSIEGDLSHGH